jgi:hypothetical protein
MFSSENSWTGQTKLKAMGLSLSLLLPSLQDELKQLKLRRKPGELPDFSRDGFIVFYTLCNSQDFIRPEAMIAGISVTSLRMPV